VWESEESFARFVDTLGPILEKLGLQAALDVRPRLAAAPPNP
jgi:hypothetical protein